MSDKILIPTSVVEAQPFENRGGIEQTLRNCYKAKCDPVYMPQLVDARVLAPKESPVWNGYITPSVRVTGKTRQRNAVVVYAHVPNYFSKPANVAKAFSKGLLFGAGRMPKKDFYNLLGLEDKQNVFVIDYDKLQNAHSGVIDVAQALEHPQVIPFLGGQTRAEQYLQKYQQVYNTTNIGVWHSDDLADEPHGRVLFLDRNYDNNLNAKFSLREDYAHFLGITRSAKTYFCY